MMEILKSLIKEEKKISFTVRLIDVCFIHVGTYWKYKAYLELWSVIVKQVQVQARKT